MIKKVAEYALGKGLELVVTFLILSVLAVELSPSNYSVVAEILVLINVSTFLYSVPGAVYVKGRSLELASTGSLSFLLSSCLAVCFLILALLFSYTSGIDYFCYVAIAVGNMARTIVQTYLRVEMKVRVLNLYNIMYPLSLAGFFVVFIVHGGITSEAVLYIFALTFVAVFLSSLVVLSAQCGVLAVTLRRLDLSHTHILFKYLFVQGGAFLLLYSERLIVLNTQESSVIGGFQLIDNFVLIPIMIMSTLMYIIQPAVMSSEYHRRNLLRLYPVFVCVGLIVIAGLYLVYLAGASWLIKTYFSAYQPYVYVLGYSLASKLLVLLAFVPNLVLITSNSESKMIMVQWWGIIIGAGAVVYVWSGITLIQILQINLLLGMVYLFTSVLIGTYIRKRSVSFYE